MSSRGTSSVSARGVGRAWCSLDRATCVVTRDAIRGGSIADHGPGGSPVGQLDQCANDPRRRPMTVVTRMREWENGNLVPAIGLLEGDSILYRLIFGDLPLASHTVTIEWDTTKSFKHALDYPTSWNAWSRPRTPVWA